MERRSKIVATLGPASSDEDTIRDLINAGLNVARINFSHGSHEDHAAIIGRVRAVADELGQPVAILQDLQGPKIRVGEITGELLLEDGGAVQLSAGDHVTNPSDPEVRLSVSYAAFASDVEAGHLLLLDDGKLSLEVERVDGDTVHARVVKGGVLTSNKGLNLPGATVTIPALTEKDIRDLEFGIGQGVDFVALSFVQKRSDIEDLKRRIADLGASTPVVAKIEKPQAVDNLDQILQVTDAIMIARGDLGVEMLPEEVPPVQKTIIEHCNQRGVPVITATQMLESMMDNARPTRAEASDVANAVLDGTDAVMLSGETAAGRYPRETVATMSRIIELAEQHQPTGGIAQRRSSELTFDTATAIGYAACRAADSTGASAIVCLTQSGSTAGLISRFRPDTPILALSSSVEARRQLNLLWGVQPVATLEFHDDIDETVDDIRSLVVERGLVPEGGKFVITTGVPFSKRRATNMLRIEEV